MVVAVVVTGALRTVYSLLLPHSILRNHSLFLLDCCCSRVVVDNRSIERDDVLSLHIFLCKTSPS